MELAKRAAAQKIARKARFMKIPRDPVRDNPACCFADVTRDHSLAQGPIVSCDFYHSLGGSDLRG
jgi:hypothetical protein